MYVRLLSEAIAQKKGEAPQMKSYECMIDVQLNAHIPEDYIENLSQRIDVYKKIASIKTAEDKMDLIDELIDRFGDIPPTVETPVSYTHLDVYKRQHHDKAFDHLLIEHRLYLPHRDHSFHCQNLHKRILLDFITLRPAMQFKE